jgi:hypothetical protein
VPPTEISAELGLTETAVTVFGTTVSIAVPVIPLSVAVTAVEPAATPVAVPPEMLAMADDATLQVACAVTFAVEPSL